MPQKKDLGNMFKRILRKFIRKDHWSFMGWYRVRFGLFPAVLRYIATRIQGIGRAPNPLNGGYVYLRPGTADQGIYDQIFGAGDYDIDLGDPVYIVDAGAHIGLSSVFFANKYPKATIIAIEPEQSNFEILLKNIDNYRNIKPMMAGLWSKKGHLRIQDPHFDNCSFRVIEDASGNGVPGVGMQDIMADFNIDHIDALKIDIEGSELEVLSNSKPWIDAVGTLMIELHDRFAAGCTEALETALSGHAYDRSLSGENIVITHIRRIATEQAHQRGATPPHAIPNRITGR